MMRTLEMLKKTLCFFGGKLPVVSTVCKLVYLWNNMQQSPLGLQKVLVDQPDRVISGQTVDEGSCRNEMNQEYCPALNLSL